MSKARMSEELTPECFERITALLEREARTDGAAAQDLAEWRMFAPAAFGTEGKEKKDPPRCDECADELYPDTPVVCPACVESTEREFRSFRARVAEDLYALAKDVQP